MEKMTVNIAPVNIEPPAVKYAAVVPIADEKNSTSTSPSSEGKTLSPDQVNISKEAHKKSVDYLNLGILVFLKVLGTSFQFKVPKTLPKNVFLAYDELVLKL